jgi:hypothetical protein
MLIRYQGTGEWLKDLESGREEACAMSGDAETESNEQQGFSTVRICISVGELKVA